MPIPAMSGYHLRMLSNLAVAKRLGWTTIAAWYGDHAQGQHRPQLLDADEATWIGPRIARQPPSGRIAQRAAWAMKAIVPWRSGSYPFSFALEEGRGNVEIAASGVDIVVLPTMLSHWVPELRRPGLRFIGDCPDIFTDVTRKLLVANALQRSIQTPSLLMNHATCYSHERRFLREFDEIWVTSDGEVERARELGARHVISLPSTSAKWDLKPTPSPGNPVVGFIGNLNLDPNLQAARFLAHEVLPILIALAPDVRLRLAGDVNHPGEFQSIKGLEYLGAIPDASQFVQECEVMALPIRVRGGVPLKLFEAMALGRPAVVTPEIIKGLPINATTDVIVADSAEDFAHSIARLLSNRVARESLAARARSTFERHFSLDSAIAVASQHSILRSTDDH
jgi:glycosyltransferase involved in cell wall biosynthesis